MKNRKKLNAVDIIIIVVFVLVVLIFGRYISKNSFDIYAASGSPVVLDISVATGSINESFIGNVKLHDAVADTENGKLLGHIEAIEVSDVYDASEHFSEQRLVPENKTMKIVIRCEAMKYEDYYVIGDKKVIIGDTYRLTSPELYFEAECSTVSEVYSSNIFRG